MQNPVSQNNGEQYALLFYHKTTYTPQDMIEAWQGILEEIENGYDYPDPDLDYDLFLRDTIEDLVADAELLKFEEHFHFIQEIRIIDEKLKPLMFPNPRYERLEKEKWWSRVLLKKGGRKYVKDIKEAFDIDIPLADN